MIERVAQRLRDAGITNVETHVAGVHRMPVPDASIDRAFVIAVMGEIPNLGGALAELHRVLKPGGILSVTEMFPDPDYLFAGETVRKVLPAGVALDRRSGDLWRY